MLITVSKRALVMSDLNIDRGSSEWIRNYEFVMKSRSNFEKAAFELGYSYSNIHNKNDIQLCKFRKMVARDFADHRYLSEPGL